MLGQITQWDFQNKGKSGWTGKKSFVLEVPLRYLRPSIIYSVPCDRIMQRAYLSIHVDGRQLVLRSEIRIFRDGGYKRGLNGVEGEIIKQSSKVSFFFLIESRLKVTKSTTLDC